MPGEVCKLRRMALPGSMAVIFAAAVHAQPGILTWHNDNGRTGQNLQETTLTLANVKSSGFGLLFTLIVDGKVDAQPLYVHGVTIPGQGLHNVVYIVTENDSVYAFDADKGTLLKQVSLLVGSETPSDNRGCDQVQPIIGITATPVIDPGSGPHGTMYLVAMTKDSSAHYHHRLHALDLTTLAEEFSGPVEIAATYSGSKGVEKKNSGDTVQTFDPSVHKERAALLLLNGVVYMAWSSHCDGGLYTGWVMGYNETNLQQVTVLNLTPNGNDGAMWAAGSGPAADANGNVYVPTGNGTFDTTLSDGFPAENDYGNAFVKMSTSGGKLGVLDYFTMSNTVSESNSDTDLASAGGMLLPPLKDSSGASRNLAVAAGKDGNLYVMDTSNLGKYHSPTDTLYQELDGVLSGGMWSSPAWFNGTLYYGPQGNVLKAFAFANGLFGMNPSSQTSAAFEYPGTTPSISANGASNGIVWAYENSSPAILHAYDASNLGNELYNSNQASNGRDHFGAGNKFIVPTVVNGKVYAAANKSCSGNSCVGEVGVFGLLTPPAPDFLLGLSPASQTVTNGSGTSYTVTATGTNGFNGTITFEASGLPSGASAGFNPTSLTGSGSTMLTVTTAANGSTGQFTVTATGTSGSINHNASASLTVNPNSGPQDFGLSISPSAGNTMVGGNAQYTLTATGTNGFSGTITFSVSGLPPGASGSFNPGSLSGSGSTTLTIATAANTALGNFTFDVLGMSGSLSHGTSASLTVNPVPGKGLAFVPVTPCRVADTRNADGPFGGPSIGASSSRDFAIPASACGIPANAQAYSLNLTVVPLGPLGFVSMWPAGQPQATVSTLNSSDGRIKANAAIVPAGASGAVTIFASNPTHVIVDINGYFVAPGSQTLAFYPLPPCRIADTRVGTGTLAGPALAGGQARNFPLLSSACNIPANAQAYALNFTVVPAGPLGFLSAWPEGGPQPGVSTLNAPTGAITANAAIVPAGSGGAITVIATDPTNLIIDVNGYFAPPGGGGALLFRPVTPCRILDTRNAVGPFGGPQLSASQPRPFVVPDATCQVPNAARAYSLNATVVPPGPLGFLTLWGNSPQPGVSTLNDSDGTIVANAALVPAGSDGSVSAFASNSTHLILDINGYFAP